jgi:hypothetical protein
VLRRVDLDLCDLERLQKFRPNRGRVVDRLQAWGERRELIVAEIALLRTGGQDQVIIG